MHSHRRLCDSRRNKRTIPRRWTLQWTGRAHFLLLAVHRTEVQKELQLYWSFRYVIAIKDGINIEGRRIPMPASMQGKAIKQQYRYISYGHRKNNKASMWVNILEQHECQYRRSNQKVPLIPRLSVHLTERQINVTWNTRVAIEIYQGWHTYS